MKKILANKKTLSIILLTLFYFSCSIFIFWDSAHYVTYLDILEGNVSWANWDMIRGIVFPLIIHISNIFFGKNANGLLITSYIFYLIMLKILSKILKEYFKNEKSKKEKTYKCLIYSFIILNPIIFGYYHTLLTEYLAITLSLITCFISYKYIYIDYEKEKKSYYKFLIGFIMLTLVSYHLKQTYITITLGPIILSILISCMTNKKLKNCLSKIATIIICCIALFISIGLWNSFLDYKGVKTNSDRNAANLLGENILTSISTEFYTIENCNDKSLKYISKEDKKKIEKNINKYYIVNIKNSDKIVDQMIIKKNKDGVISTKDALFTTIKVFIEHPNVVLKSYFSNYMALINLYPKVTEDNVVYNVVNDFSITYCHENCAIAYATNDTRTNLNYLSEHLHSKVVYYEEYNNPPIIIRKILNFLEPLYEKFYQIMYLLMPFMLLLNLVIRMFKNLKIDKKSLNLSLILLGFAFIHMLSCVIIRLTIDRYSIASFIPCFLGEVLLIISMINLFKRRGKK